MQSGEKVIYYESMDEEHSGKQLKIKKPIDKNYKYINNNVFYKIYSFITYRLIATPIAFVYCKLFKRIKVENKKVLKKCKGKGYFVFANHTNQYSDVFTPHIISFPKKTYTVVNAENVNVPLLGDATKTLGAIPIPTKLDGTRNFMNCMEKRILQGHPVLIYPEAHIWPYYTGIRPYSSTSFRYPVKFREPSYCYTTTYQKQKNSKKPKIVVYVDGPFYPDRSLNEKEQQEKLRNEIYACMLERSKNSNYEYVKYVPKLEDDEV